MQRILKHIKVVGYGRIVRDVYYHYLFLIKAKVQRIHELELLEDHKGSDNQEDRYGKLGGDQSFPNERRIDKDLKESIVRYILERTHGTQRLE